MSFADGMKNFETRRSSGFCGKCNKTTYALWERCGEKLTVSCEDCGIIIIDDNVRFKPGQAKEQSDGN